MKTAMRAQREKVQLLKDGKADADDAKDALLNPIKIDDKETSVKYVGKKATVSVNPITGVLIQCNPTHHQKVKRLQNGNV